MTVPCTLLTLMVMLPAREAKAEASAQIVNPQYATNSTANVYYSDQQVESTLKVKNTGTTRATFWIRYSVHDKAGRTYDVAASSVTLNPGATSALQSKYWRVPDPADPSTLTTGFYGASFSVYDANPDTNPDVVRLDYAEQADAFRAHDFIDRFNSFNTARWLKSAHNLGLSYLDPDNVSVNSNDQLRIKIPANTTDGGEIESQNFYKYGTYEARLKVPDAPSSITGFFLYAGPDYEKEIDVELYNQRVLDPSTGTYKGEIMFTTYAPHYYPDGTLIREPTHTTTMELPFDPTAGFHTYRFDLYPDSVSFYADDVLMQTWTDALPTSQMKLLVNTWFPSWVPEAGKAPTSNKYTYVEWIRH